MVSSINIFQLRYFSSLPCEHHCTSGKITERRSWVVNTPASYSGGHGLKSQSGDQISWLEISRCFPQSLQANTETAPEI
jgi:hypothetical protein